jgi:hypothetical protein
MPAAEDVYELSPLALAEDAPGGKRARATLDEVLGASQKTTLGTENSDGAETRVDYDIEATEDDATETDSIAPCCQNTGPCRWDAVCATHVGQWETTHGEAYFDFLARTNGVIPEWLRDETGTVHFGQRGSLSKSATAGAAIAHEEADARAWGIACDENGDEEDIGLLGNGGDGALVEVAGRGEADGEPEPFSSESVMELDDEDVDELNHLTEGDPIFNAAMAREIEVRDASARALTLVTLDEAAIEE